MGVVHQGLWFDVGTPIRDRADRGDPRRWLRPSKPATLHHPCAPAFADALAAGLIRRFGGEPLGLARGLVLLPNNRAKRAMTDAFVRASEGGLLLPRLVSIGELGRGDGRRARPGRRRRSGAAGGRRRSSAG